MIEPEPIMPGPRRRALSRWENEGGAVAPAGPVTHAAPAMNAPEPYGSTPIFDQDTLPAGLRKEHRTKVGVWGVIRVLEGRLRFQVLDPVDESVLDVDRPGLVLPGQPHLVEPLGRMRMRVDFYDSHPEEAGDRRQRLPVERLGIPADDPNPKSIR